jgi:hypothetical protein
MSEATNLVCVPRDEIRNVPGEDFSQGLLLLPAKYVPEARRVGILRSPDPARRGCRVCGQRIGRDEEFLEIVIKKIPNGLPSMGFIHTRQCLPEGQEAPESLSREEWTREWEKIHPQPDPEEQYWQSEYDDDRQDESNSYPQERGIVSELIVHVSTGVERTCPLCEDVQIGRGRFEESCNHLIADHGLKCLHVGSETHFGESVNPGIFTVAVFGK